MRPVRLYRSIMRSAWESIRARVFLASMVPTVLLAVVVVYMQWHAHSRGQRLVEERGHLLAQSLSDAAVVGVIAADRASLQRLARAFASRHTEIAGIEIFGRSDELLVRFVPGVDLEIESAGSGATVPLVGSSDRPIFRDDVRIEAAPLDIELFVANESSKRPSVSKLGSVALAVDVEALGTDIWRQQWPVVSSAFFLLLLSFFASRYLVVWSVAPLKGAIASLREPSADASDQSATDLEVLERAVNVVTETREAQLARIESALIARTKSLRESVERERVGNAERRQLIQQISNTIEAERKSIAGELHDELGASCTLIRVSAEHITKLSGSPEREKPDTLKEIQANAVEIIGMSQNVYAAVRRIVRQLRPETLETLGLSATLQELAESYNDAQRGETMFHAQIDTACDQIPFPLQMAVYRLVQEAFTNVVKHAGASTCRLQVDMLWGSYQLKIVIEDDGVGLSLPVLQPRGSGMIGMSERIEALEGELTFSAPMTGRGTVITAKLPLPSASTH
jgi:two-component system sensor histidine kinase UhpB